MSGIYLLNCVFERDKDIVKTNYFFQKCEGVKFKENNNQGLIFLAKNKDYLSYMTKSLKNFNSKGRKLDVYTTFSMKMSNAKNNMIGMSHNKIPIPIPLKIVNLKSLFCLFNSLMIHMVVRIKRKPVIKPGEYSHNTNVNTV